MWIWVNAKTSLLVTFYYGFCDIMFATFCVFKLWFLTEIVPGSQDNDDSILAFQGLPHILFVQNISHHHSGCFVVSRQPGRVPNQHGRVVSWANISEVKQINETELSKLYRNHNPKLKTQNWFNCIPVIMHKCSISGNMVLILSKTTASLFRNSIVIV